MLDKLRILKNQYEQLQRRMEEPETYSDPALYARCEREARELAPIVGAYCEYERAEEDMRAALELMDDAEMRELAQEEYAEAKARMAELSEKMKLLLLDYVLLIFSHRLLLH